MKQTYILIALIILSLFLGYKLVSYKNEISQLTELANRKDAQINELKRDKIALTEDAAETDSRRFDNGNKVVTVYRTIEKEVSDCDDKPIGDEFINSLQQLRTKR